MNLPEEIQNEINKVKKLEGEISILLKKRTERSERGLSTTSVRKFLKSFLLGRCQTQFYD